MYVHTSGKDFAPDILRIVILVLVLVLILIFIFILFLSVMARQL